MAHTQGPWSASEDNAGGGLNIFDATGRRIAHTAEVNSAGPRPLSEARRIASDEAKGNAKLIAAAPDMLAALRGMVDNYVDTYGDEGDDAPASIKAAIAAIAKAGG